MKNTNRGKLLTTIKYFKPKLYKKMIYTGRLYEFNCTNANRHTPFKEPIVSSNLCIASNQLVPSNKGLLTAEELYNLKENLILTDGQKEVISSPMKLREFSQDVYKITLKNGMSHTVTDYHKIMTKRGLVKCKDLIIKEDYAKMIVKSYKSRSSESRAMFILSSENFLTYFKAVHIKNTLFLL